MARARQMGWCYEDRDRPADALPIPTQRSAEQPGQPRDVSPPADPEDLATLCHDLRQSVTAALLLAHLPDPGLDQELRRRIALIHESLTHANRLLERVTDAATTTEDEETVVDLQVLLGQCVGPAQACGDLRVELLTTESAFVRANPLLLRRALANLIDNALRAAGAEGEVTVWLGTGAQSAWVDVVDDGPGFGRIEHGTGRGMSVVSAAIRACSGRLEITSGPGPGTSVRITLPRILNT